MSFKFEFSYENTTAPERALFTKFLIEFSELKYRDENGFTPAFLQKSYREEHNNDKTLDTQPIYQQANAISTDQEELDRALLFGDSGLDDIEHDAVEEPPIEPVLPEVLPPPVFHPTPSQPVELDAAGIPWDERIHSVARTKTKAGLWRTRKNVTEELVNSVTYELRTRTVPNLIAPSPTVAAPAVAAPVPPPPPAEIETETPFQALMKFVVSCIGQNLLTSEKVIEILKPFGVGNVVELQSKPDLIGPVTDALKLSVQHVR